MSEKETADVVKLALASRYALLMGWKPKTPSKRPEWHQEVRTVEAVWKETFGDSQGDIDAVAKEISRAASVKEDAG